MWLGDLWGPVRVWALVDAILLGISGGKWGGISLEPLASDTAAATPGARLSRAKFLKKNRVSRKLVKS